MVKTSVFTSSINKLISLDVVICRAIGTNYFAGLH